MKKTALFILAAMLTSLFLFIPKSLAVDAVSVAECTKQESHWQSAEGKILSQGFRPEYDTISRIEFWLGGVGKVFVNIIALEQDNSVLFSTELDYDGPGHYVLDNWDFSPIKVYPGDHYALTMTSPVNSEHSSWQTSSDPNCYPITSAQVDGAAPTDPLVKDYHFAIYGYNTPADTPAVIPADNSTPAANTTTPPAATTSSAISAPTDLTAASMVNGSAPSVALKWTVSKTADIDGYQIYRSQEETSGFTLLATTNKLAMETVDSAVSSKTTYYYFVRAYKGANESASSNTAKATALVKKSVPIINANVDPNKFEMSWLLWGLSGVAVLLLGILILLMLRRRRLAKRKITPQLDKV